jgi:uncharacterized protein YkwD
VRPVALVFVLVACALPVAIAEAATPRPGDRAPAGSRLARGVVQEPELQNEVLAAINALRRSKGLRELRPNSALSRTALAHSVSMATHGFFEHSGWDGSAFWQRIKSGYPPRQGAWSVGENLVWATPALSADQAVAMWLKSPPHRKNLLGSWREIGLGAVRALSAPGVYEGLDVTILTADFGAR